MDGLAGICHKCGRRRTVSKDPEGYRKAERLRSKRTQERKRALGLAKNTPFNQELQAERFSVVYEARQARVAFYAAKRLAEKQLRPLQRKIKSLLIKKAKAKAKDISKPWNAPGISEADRYRLRYKLDPEFALRNRIRCRLRQRLKTGHKSHTVERLLGYSMLELKRHIERQFSGRMSWEAFHRGDIHIDHILPLSSFDLKDEEEFRRAWSLPNLRPLWARDNRVKHTTRLTLL